MLKGYNILKILYNNSERHLFAVFTKWAARESPFFCCVFVVVILRSPLFLSFITHDLILMRDFIRDFSFVLFHA
jgi:hypothetical protein